MRVQGWDLSMNHAGFVELEDGKLSRFWFVTDRAGTANRNKRGIRLLLPETSADIKRMYRLELWEKFFNTVLLKRPPDVIGIESYAFAAKSRVVEMGELGAIARRAMWNKRIPFRAYAPTQIKKFATHDGTASKDDMMEAARSRWGVSDFTGIDDPKAKGSERFRTEEDLSDALAAAQLAWTEYQLRMGLVSLSDLDPKEIQVFNSTSKANPVNILALEWTKRGA